MVTALSTGRWTKEGAWPVLRMLARRLPLGMGPFPRPAALVVAFPHPSHVPGDAARPLRALPGEGPGLDRLCTRAHTPRFTRPVSPSAWRVFANSWSARRLFSSPGKSRHPRGCGRCFQEPDSCYARGLGSSPAQPGARTATCVWGISSSKPEPICDQSWTELKTSPGLGHQRAAGSAPPAPAYCCPLFMERMSFVLRNQRNKEYASVVLPFPGLFFKCY